ASASAAKSSAVDEIIDRVEARYAGEGFAADFLQESIIKAMDISDFAKGKIFVRRPGMMRWEYEEPDKQVIITDGQKLWIYRPEDNQVLTGLAPAFFRDGKGASFLADIKILRRKFDISLGAADSDLFYELKLVPHTKTLDVTDIRLSISKNTFAITSVVTYNSYGDETRVELLNTKFDQKLDESLFSFEIPEGVEVLQIDE
ncbi:MAG: outer membrane lipoprotein carrier protein LolA, partial [Desulfobacterales bacterium]